MTQPKQPDHPRPDPLDYARHRPQDTRTSKLAVIALLVALLSSPCLLVPLSNWINWYVPQDFNQVGRYGFLHFWVRTAAMALGTLLSTAAVIRIRASRGRLLGKTVARAALVISLLWWALLALLFIAVMLMGAGWKN